jgi:TonB family protein
MQKTIRLFMAAIFGMAITIGLVFFMIALITLNNDKPESDNYLTTQVKVSSPPGVKPSETINSNSKKKHHQLPSKRKVNLPINHQSLLSDIQAQQADGDQTDPFAAPSRQQILHKRGSQSQAAVKLPGLFNVIGPDPQYPSEALLAGQEGWVETMIHLKKDGTVDKVDILNAGPAGVFELSVVTAVIDWKVELDSMPEDKRADEYLHRFEFKISK